MRPIRILAFSLGLFLSSSLSAQKVGINTTLPEVELDIRTDATNDGSELNLGNLDNSHFLRLFSGRVGFPSPLIYWKPGLDLQFGTANVDGSGYQQFLNFNGKTIGVFNTGQSIFLGEGAGENDDVSDNRNIAIGNWSLFNNINGYSNVAVGDSALYNSTTGTRNVAIGQSALFSSASDGSNTAVGNNAGYKTNGSIFNVFVGNNAGYENSTGRDNTFLGNSAAWHSNDGDNNTAVGSNAAGFLIGGGSNTALGFFAGYGTADGNNNVYIGSLAAANFTGAFTNSENVVIGVSAAIDDPGNKNVLVGYSTGGGIKNGMRNTIIGHKAASATISALSNCVILGADAGTNATRNNSLIIDNSATTSPLIYGEFDNNFLRINGQQEVTGELNIDKTGVALRINDQEALWSDANYFSWGFGTGHNYFAKPIRVGPVEGSTTPFADLHVVDNSGIANLTIESYSSDAVLQLAGNTNDALSGWTIRRQGSNGDLVVKNNSLRKLTLTSFGNLGLNVSNPLKTFEVSGTSKIATSVNTLVWDNYVSVIENTSNNNSFRNHGLLIIAGHDNWMSTPNRNSSFITFKRPDGTLIGGIDQLTTNQVAYYTTSDKRRKKGIVSTKFGLNELLKIEVNDYYWKDDADNKHLQTGFIAQQLHTAYPSAVKVGGDDVKHDPWQVEPLKLIPLLVKSTQEQQLQIDQLTAQNAQLQNQLDKLQTELLQKDHSVAQMEALLSQLSQRVEKLEAPVQLTVKK